MVWCVVSGWCGVSGVRARAAPQGPRQMHQLPHLRRMRGDKTADRIQQVGGGDGNTMRHATVNDRKC
jgi:hypothetical protein